LTGDSDRPAYVLTRSDGEEFNAHPDAVFIAFGDTRNRDLPAPGRERGRRRDDVVGTGGWADDEGQPCRPNVIDDEILVLEELAFVEIDAVAERPRRDREFAGGCFALR